MSDNVTPFSAVDVDGGVDDDERLKNRENADFVSTSAAACVASTTEEEGESSGDEADAGTEEISGDSVVDAEEVDGCATLGGACSVGGMAEDEDEPGDVESVALSRGVVVRVRTTDAGERAGMVLGRPLQRDG